MYYCYRMIILSIETSCDETAISLIEVTGDFPTATYHILGNALWSQVDIHREFGGVFPALAKREHTRTLVPMLKQALTDAELLADGHTELTSELQAQLHTILEREDGLAEALLAFLAKHQLPEIDFIAVTSGPGLEPALWVGISFTKALAAIFDCPVIPVNHMEGHVLASVFDAVENDQLAPLTFPAIALLISGGHTELLLMSDWGHYEKIGQTRDDAVGEAFDKVARLLGLPYPGGPEIGRLANEARQANLPPFKTKLPRPMLTSDDLDFSFSGLKTAVRYTIEDVALTDTDKQALARDFEDAVTEVLLKKTSKAIETHGATTLIVGGGVSASRHIKETFQSILITEHPEVTVYFPPRHLATDNAIMIALAGHARLREARTAGSISLITANGNQSIA